jgi:hypothetical protein
MAYPEVPAPRICARPGCDEIVMPPADGGDFPLYHSRECRALARKLRRTAARERATSAAASRTQSDETAHTDGLPEAETAAPVTDTAPVTEAAPVAGTAPAGAGNETLVAGRTRTTGARKRGAAGPGAHRAEPSRRWRKPLAIGGGMVAAAVLAGLLVPQLTRGSGQERGAIAGQAVGRSPRPSARVSPSAARSPATVRKKHQTARHSGPSAVVPVADHSEGTPAQSRSAAPAHQRTGPATFSALTGPGCPSSSDAGIAIDSTWYQQSSGGSTGNGCSGMFYAKWVHQPGADTVRTFTWWFRTGLAGNATCRVNVYIPDGDDTTVGANPAPYYVYSGSSGSQETGSFTLDQLDNHGQWLYAGAYPASGGRFSVQVQNVGSGSVEVAADLLAVACTA